jgi:lysyl-tRNA synthetase class 1
MLCILKQTGYIQQGIRHVFFNKSSGDFCRVSLNIINASAANNSQLLTHYLAAYQLDLQQASLSMQQLVHHVVNYYQATILPHKQQFAVSTDDIAVMAPVAEALLALPNVANLAAIHACLLQLKEQLRPSLDMRDWYQLLYRCALGQMHGPRLAKYIALIGVHEFASLISQRLAFLITRSATVQRDVVVPAIQILKNGPSMNMPTANTANSTSSTTAQHALLTPIEFTVVLARATKFAAYLQSNVEAIATSLASFECYNVAVDEVDRCIEFLTNLEVNQEYFRYAIGGVTTFLPLNQPLYATMCFGVVPSLMAREVYLRPPTAMQNHYKKLTAVLNLGHFFTNLHISYDDKEVFVAQRAPRTDTVIFTGTPENAAKVRSKFLRRTLFILNGAGHNPLVVTDDADIGRSIHSALRVVLYNQGQDCAGPNAILVHVNNYERFVTGLKHELAAIAHLVGPYEDKENIVGPNSDLDHTLKISKIFKEERDFCTYGGEINPINGLIRPTIFEKPLAEGGNYREFFAPIFFVQRYASDADLQHYFAHERYQPNAMYISLFGSSHYIEGLIASGLHPQETVLRETDLHHTEKGYLPYGGLGPAASCLYVNGERRTGATLPQRDIYFHLVKPFEASLVAGTENILTK